MISFVIFSVKRAWQGFWRNAVMSLAATATMVLMLLLLAGFWIIQTGLLAGLQFTEQKVEVVAYLQPNATDGQIDRSARTIERAARGRVGDASSRRDEALEQFRASMKAAGPRGPHPVPRQQPALREHRGQADRPAAVGAVSDVARSEGRSRSCATSSTSRTWSTGC